ncbi:type II secretion system protein [bacterium]|nr:type II secretion system protein [bacterium]
MMLLRIGRGFTLLEMMIVVGLSSLLYSILCYVSVQMNTSVRRTEDGFKRQKAAMKIAENIRWQLRSLYARVPEGASTTEPPSTNIHPATLRNRYIYGKKNSTADGSILLFKTAYFPKNRGKVGVAEVGYAIKNVIPGSMNAMEPVNGKDFIDNTLEFDNSESGFLVYRQFTWADPIGLHEETDIKEAPWMVASTDIINFKAEYSEDGEIWQQEWMKEGIAKWVRVTLSSKRNPPIVFVVSPAVSSNRW